MGQEYWMVGGLCLKRKIIMTTEHCTLKSCISWTYLVVWYSYRWYREAPHTQFVGLVVVRVVGRLQVTTAVNFNVSTTNSWNEIEYGMNILLKSLRNSGGQFVRRQCRQRFRTKRRDVDRLRLISQRNTINKSPDLVFAWNVADTCCWIFVP